VSGINEDDDRHIWVFDPKTTWARVEDDEDGLPVLVIGDGNDVIELPAGTDMAEAAAATRRITEQIWIYLQAIHMRRLGQERQARVEAARPNGVGVDQLLKDAGNSNPGGA
jgi:hypothetical protein